MRWPTRTGAPPLAAILTLVGALLLLAVVALPAGMVPETFKNALPRLGAVIKDFIVIPDWRYTPALFWMMLDTVGMAFLAALLGSLLAFPLALLMARNTTVGLWLAIPLRVFAAVIRAIPELVWAIAFVAAVGTGPIPGVLALGVYTLGTLAKFHQLAFDVVDTKPLEGLSAVGASGFASRWFGVLPQAFPDLLGHWLYAVDSNIRSATVLGIVGAGGIGFDYSEATRLYKYDRLILIIPAIYLVVTLLDRLSARIRRRYT
jgi:phosphonate transport system permease protein